MGSEDDEGSETDSQREEEPKDEDQMSGEIPGKQQFPIKVGENKQVGPNITKQTVAKNGGDQSSGEVLERPSTGIDKSRVGRSSPQHMVPHG